MNGGSAGALAILLFFCCVLNGCTNRFSSPSDPTLASTPVQRSVATRKGCEERVSLAEAEALVERHMRKEKPQLHESARFPLRERTTDLIWDRLRVQLFQVTEGIYEFETFVIRKGKVYQIGYAFGGQGVNSFCLADLTRDGRSCVLVQPELECKVTCLT